jgi:hypothetical protein
MKYYKYLNIALISLIVFLSSCIIVKHDNEILEKEPEVAVSPKPVIPLSDNFVRSVKGDMIAFLPEGWFLINVENKISPDVIAVAVNPEYNMSAVFTNMKNSSAVVKKVEQEGLFGLAWSFLSKRENKTAGMVKQIGKFQSIIMGNRRFVKYEYSSTSGAIVAKSAVFISSINDYYEFSLIPINVNGNLLPETAEINNVFQSVLAGIKY